MRKYINQQDMKQANAADVFNLIRENGCLTRKQIEAMTNLSWGAVSNITARLIEHQYIKEFKMENSGAGRTPSCLEVNGDEHFVIGLDINVSGFQAILVNLKNEILGSLTRSVEFIDRESLLHEIFAFAKDAVILTGEHHVLCVGIAMQGVVDSRQGISMQVPICADWINVPLAELLEEELGIPVYLEHDPNCSLYAYSTMNEMDEAILIRVDKGIGMAVMLDGKIFERPGMFEIGHSTVVMGGNLCSCGKKGCLEVYASQRGMAKISGTPFVTLAEMAREGEKEALKLFYEMSSHLAKVIANAAHMLCVQNVILCGDMWNYCDIFYEQFMKDIKNTVNDSRMRFTIVETESAATGAALIALDHFVEQIEF